MIEGSPQDTTTDRENIRVEAMITTLRQVGVVRGEMPVFTEDEADIESTSEVLKLFVEDATNTVKGAAHLGIKAIEGTFGIINRILPGREI